MIVTVTLNPMLDKTVAVDRLRRGEIHRATKIDCVVGGKGVNVARQLQRFGVATIATGLLGGEVGEQLARLLTAEGLEHDFFRIAGMTREGVTYREPDNTWTAVFEPPHQVTAREAEELVLHCSRLLSGAAWVVCSGSSPCPETEGTYARIITAAQGHGCKTYLDSYGTAFRQALHTRPTVVQCNRAELAASFGKPVATDRGLRDAMAEIIAGGVGMVIVTDGSRPAFAAQGKAMWKVLPPSVKPVNPTGSGDCLAAGVLRELDNARSFASALRYGAAAGAANATRWDVAAVSTREIEEIAPTIRIEELT
jgi:1-phosphofructokinase family hexose kinase